MMSENEVIWETFTGKGIHSNLQVRAFLTYWHMAYSQSQ